MASFEDYYEILQVSPSAEPEVIEGAYKKLAQKYHPDVNKSPTATEKMKKINVAHDVLGDPVQRKRYHAEWLQRKGEKTSYTETHAPPEPKPSSKPQPRQQQWGAKRKPPPTTKQPSKKRRKITAYVISGLVVLIVIPIILMHTIFSPQYKIAFVSASDDNLEIYVMDADGGNLVRLVDNAEFATEPSWSPDGKKIAFHSTFHYNQLQYGCNDIYIINADGSNLRKITNSTNCEVWWPEWSPDGKKIAFIVTRKEADTFTTRWACNILIINADGSNQMQLTNNYPSRDYSLLPYNAHDLAWSPDGEKIAFESYNNNFDGLDIYVVNSDGTGQKRLTSTSGPFWNHCPRWSPDGTRIVFFSNRDGFSNNEIYTMDSDGGNQTRLTNNPASDLYPAWSPDGKKIAFISDRDSSDNWGLYVMNADRSNQTRLTNDSASGLYPAWSPDGKKIAFVSDCDGSAQIYVINSDGSNQKRLTNNTANNMYPVWSPR